MLIPSVLRPQVLEGLHATNQGVTGMILNARERFFWPGFDAAVRILRQQCRQCNEQAPSQSSETPIVSPSPRVPFEQTVTDLFSLEGHKFLVYADRFSGRVEVERLSSSAFRQVRRKHCSSGSRRTGYRKKLRRMEAPRSTLLNILRSCRHGTFDDGSLRLITPRATGGLKRQ